MAAKVLVVDDEPDLELLVKQKFKKEIRAGDVDFRFAFNGKSALKLLASEPDIDVVLTDLNMPEMDGLELLERLKQENAALGAIVISAYGDIGNIRAAMNRGAFDFVTKPIDFTDLKLTLKKTIGRVQEGKALARVRREKEDAQARALEQERRAKEAQRQLIEHLKRMDRLKDEFLANTTHELRTPINGVIGIVESLLDGAAGTLTDEAKRNLSMVIASGRRLSRLIDDILDFSKMKTGDISLVREPVDVYGAVDMVLALSRAVLGGKVIDLQNRVSRNTPPVIADPNRLQQILFNLIGNAVKFTEEGWIAVSAETRGEFVEIMVKDTGVGIPKSRFEDIFKMFEQVEQADTRKQGGVGLGLAITKKLVELSGGEIAVNSVEGKGSTFRFTMPVSSEKPSPAGKAQRLTSALKDFEDASVEFVESGGGAESGQAVILAVDDEPVNHQALGNMLKLNNYRVRYALNGPEALAALAEKDHGVDLVVLDVMMPGMSGFEVCETIRQSRTLFELPILMLTARNQVKDFVRGLEVGANDYVAKPFEKGELLARVRTLLSLKRAVGTAIDRQRRLREEQRRAFELQAEKVKLEQQALSSAQAEEVALAESRQKTDFLALMSHELRTPLNAIIGYSEMLAEDMEGAGFDSLLTDLQRIRGSADNLLALINNLLDLTKIEAGKMDVYLETFRLGLLFDEVVGTVQPIAAKNGNTLDIALGEGVETVLADVAKLRMVLVNLLGNACKFTKSGRVALSAEAVERDGGPWARIWIKDTGPGMNEAQRARLFQPFGQGGKPPRGQAGTGLGLVIAKHFCRMMNGEIGVESEPGKGSAFWVCLPAQAVKPG